MDNQLKRQRQEEEELESSKRVELDPDDFRANMARKAKENQLVRFLKAAVSICQKLDQDNEIEVTPILTHNTIKNSLAL
jgi:hypothetical protein